MKVEGMQYPLQVKPIGARNNHRDEKDLSDDAVYFEPEEHKEKKQNSEQQKEEQESTEAALENLVAKEIEPAQSTVPAVEKKPGERSPLNIIV